MNIMSALQERILIFDGAMGSLLQERLAPETLPELCNREQPEWIEAIHRAYLQAGADILTTNTFGAHRFKLNGSGYSVEEIVASGVALARRVAADKPGSSVALDIGPLGRLLQPLGSLGFEEAYQAFAEQVRIGARAGADLVLIETMSDTYELKAAVLAAKENCDLPVFATVSFDAEHKLLTGADVPAVVALLEGLGVDALGINCGLGPTPYQQLFAELISYASLPLLVQPNAGLPQLKNGRPFYDVDAEAFAAAMQEIAAAGARLVGGCCGTTPEHIRRMAERIRDLPPRPLVAKQHTLVSSYGSCVEIGPRPIVIGERINPTGKKRLQEALRSGDTAYLLEEALAQQEAGADMLDVNVGLPELQEADVMVRTIRELQNITRLPLQIDSADPATLAAALRVYNGKAMINSVNGKAEVMAQVFPLAKKYGGVVVGLTLDEHGIPATATGRLAIAQRILETAANYGIARKDIVIDALTLVVSHNQNEAQITLETVRRLREELQVPTLLGISNISFGLPRREVLNRSFLTLALQAGLSAAIINPCSPEMMESYYAYLTLAKLDPDCAGYIDAMSPSSTSAMRTETAQERGLKQLIIDGLRDRAYESCRALLQEREPLEIIDRELIPALDIVGQGFEQHRLFLPQLLRSADAAQHAFQAIRAHYQQQGIRQAQKGTIVLATVRGDIHDIGKNIVAVLLESYGYAVLDLGKDVEPRRIVEAARDSKADVVGLSALMTGTVAAMQETIALLRGAELPCRIIVGGAVLNDEYARLIGADAYGSDAMAMVRYVQQVLAAPR